MLKTNGLQSWVDEHVLITISLKVPNIWSYPWIENKRKWRWERISEKHLHGLSVTTATVWLEWELSCCNMIESDAKAPQIHPGIKLLTCWQPQHCPLIHAWVLHKGYPYKLNFKCCAGGKMTLLCKHINILEDTCHNYINNQMQLRNNEFLPDIPLCHTEMWSFPHH